MLCRLRCNGGVPGGRVGCRCTITVVRAYVGVTDNNRPGREFLEWHLDEVFLKAAAT